MAFSATNDRSPDLGRAVLRFSWPALSSPVARTNVVHLSSMINKIDFFDISKGLKPPSSSSLCGSFLNLGNKFRFGVFLLG